MTTLEDTILLKVARAITTDDASASEKNTSKLLLSQIVIVITDARVGAVNKRSAQDRDRSTVRVDKVESIDSLEVATE